MGMRLTSGRELAETDRADSEPVIVVSESLARALYPGQDAVGRMAQRRTGVSCASSASSATSGRPASRPVARCTCTCRMSQVGDGGLDLVVRSSLPVASIAPAIRRTMGELDPTLSATDLRPLEDLIERAISPRRFLVCAARRVRPHRAGARVHRHLQHRGVQRRRTCARVRRAHGAGRDGGRHQSWCVPQTATLAAVGVTIGGLVSLWLARLMTALLYETSLDRRADVRA